MTFTAFVQKGDLKYVATCMENWVVSQGDSPEESIENLKEAVFAYSLETTEQWVISAKPFSFISNFSLPLQYA